MDVEQRAREMLAHVYCCDAAELSKDEVRAARAVLAYQSAVTPPEGHLVVTRNGAGQAVAVTRQDDEGRILSVIAEFETPDGYVLVPVKPTEAMVDASMIRVELAKRCGPGTLKVLGARSWDAMLAARPEVPDGRG